MSFGVAASAEYVMSTGPASVASTRPMIAAPHDTRGCGVPYTPTIQLGAQPSPSSTSSGLVPVRLDRSAPSTIGNTSRLPWTRKSITPTVAPSASVGASWYAAPSTACGATT